MKPITRLFAPVALLMVIATLSSCRKTTRLLVVNALPAQTAEIIANNNDSRINVTSVAATDARDFADYDAVMVYSRGIYFDSLQTAQICEAAAMGTIIYSNDGSCSNLTPTQADTLTEYLRYPCRQNYVALLDYIRTLTGQSSAPAHQPITIPEAMYYHIEAGHYFESIDDYRNYLQQINKFHPEAPSIALICGITFPVEGNRQHVDSLISRLDAEGYNVYPISARGEQRNRMIRETNPDAVIFLPMGRLADDSLCDWLHRRGTPLFMPFPLTLTHDDWMNPDIPLTAGTLTARVTVPEIDGGITPTCIATQNPDDDGFIVNTLEPEQLDRFIARLRGTLNLRTKRNADKRIAIVYFKMPGRDALVASGMEVVPSLHAFLKRLKVEGYRVDNLPATEKEFADLIASRGAVMGAYASEAQQHFMDTQNPLWISKESYEQMVRQTIRPEKYQETVERYGPAPGKQLSRGDSLAVAALQFGNVLILPQPRPALGDDEFRIVHGAKVAPPHSYIAPYLYIQHEFGADALIHFGTHGNLEFLPGNNAALSFADWSEALVGPIPHFYFYTIANVGEGIIAKRRTQAATVTYLTPPFIENGMREKLAPLIEAVHRAISSPTANTPALKQRLAKEGFIGDLRIDSVTPVLILDELERIDSYIEELATEKVTGTFYVMGRPYSESELTETQLAMGADKLAYSHARDDFRKGLITDSMLNNQLYINHHYLPSARAEILRAIATNADSTTMSAEMRDIMRYRRLLVESAGAETDAMLAALSGTAVTPTPGGDPVALPNVLPTGRNLYSVNVEATPDANAWLDGQRLAEESLADYYRRHGEYPRKVNYTFWAGEFITTRGTTIAQALRLLGVEPVRDSRGRAVDLRLIPSTELGRPRIDVTVQVSGQLRDIAASRLKMIGDAVRLAAEATDDAYPNYVRESSVDIERRLAEKGTTPLSARRLSTKRIFGPVNNGYS
ncbi:MAG: cobaltochelatase subunit CobN, partial [Roseburia sp.]|nr:cobaltochelatase subunit CobN [Roseburia sp.]